MTAPTSSADRRRIFTEVAKRARVLRNDVVSKASALQSYKDVPNSDRPFAGQLDQLDRWAASDTSPDPRVVVGLLRDLTRWARGYAESFRQSLPGHYRACATGWRWIERFVADIEAGR